MPGKGCGKGGHRAHTPITSGRQQGKMGSAYAFRTRRVKPGDKGYAKAKQSSEDLKGMTTAELKSHLKESAGKNLPHSARKKR